MILSGPSAAGEDPNEGQEPTLLFLHHFGGSGRSWRGVIDRLPGHYCCIAPDLPGFGSASGCPGPFTTSASADGIIALIEELGLRDYRLIGHSMGGKIALAVAARAPEGLRALILLSPSPPTPEPIENSDRAHLLASWGDRDAMTTLIEKITARPLSVADREQHLADMLATSKPAWEAWLNHGSREDISASLVKIGIPISIVSGEGDETIPGDVLRGELLQRAPRATLEIVPGAGHLLPVEAPDEVASIIQRNQGEPVSSRVSAAGTATALAIEQIEGEH
jgi:pimeloyl-ACP methyl ester carboxylesterase